LSKVQPRFDLLDEYSTLVPFGLGVARNRAFQDPAVPAKAAKRGTIANLASHLGLLRRLLGAVLDSSGPSQGPRVGSDVTVAITGRTP
jgi:hypothetical protein